jgi:outer membrane lipoprotein LolB
MSHRRLLLLALPLACAILPGCASLQQTTAATNVTAAAPRVYRDNIELSGRLLVRYQQNDREQSLPGSFEWKQDKNSTTVTLLTPTGQTAATIIVKRDGAVLLQAKQAPRQAADLDGLLTQTLGWSMPVAGMRDWLQGFISDSNGKRIAVESGKDISLRADGWQLRYASWQDDTPAMPKRLDLERYSNEAGKVSLRIVIDQWKAI